LTAYLAAWIAACILAAAFAFMRRGELRDSYAGYGRYLAVPWKLATFAIAASGIALVAPYTGDPTWDWFDALFMSVLTFATAPWAVGVLYLSSRGARPAAHALLAGCAWLFSASWSYDAYLLLRDGYYPVTWSANMAASSVLYACAGLLWNLEHSAGRGVILGFMRPGWPSPPASRAFRPLVWAAAPFMAIAAVAILWFVWNELAAR
jgi:hypothetical protein